MTITRDVLVDIMRTPDLKDKHAGFVGFEDIHNWTWCYDKSRLGGCNNVYSMQEVQRLYALGIPTETPEEKEVLDGIESAGEAEWKNGDKPKSGQDVFIAQMNTLSGVESKRYFIHQYWCNSNHQNQLLDLGILFTDSDSATSKTKSLLGIAEEAPETPQQRKDRERACAIYDMCAEADIFNEESNFWAGKFYDLGYKKDKTHGTN